MLNFAFESHVRIRDFEAYCELSIACWIVCAVLNFKPETLIARLYGSSELNASPENTALRPTRASVVVTTTHLISSQLNHGDGSNSFRINLFIEFHTEGELNFHRASGGLRQTRCDALILQKRRRQPARRKPRLSGGYRQLAICCCTEVHWVSVVLLMCI